MNFKKMFKTLAVSSVVLITLLMVVVNPVMGLNHPSEFERIPLDDVVYPDGYEPVGDITAPITKLACKLDGHLVRCIDHWMNDNLEVRVQGYDLDSGVEATFYNIREFTTKEPTKDLGTDYDFVLRYTEGNDFKIETEGIKIITFYSVDNAGNVESPKEVILKVDKTAPTLSFRMPAETNTEAFEVDFTQRTEDRLSGIANYMYSLDNGKTLTEADHIAFTTEGTFNVQVYVEDLAGNIASANFTTTLDFPNTGGNDGDGDNNGGSSNGGSYTSKTFYPTEAEVEAGFTALMHEWDRIVFTLNGEDYTLTLKDIYSGNVYIDVDGTLKFVERQTQSVDLDGNDLKDFKVTVGTIDYTTALVSIQSIDETPVSDEVEDETEDEVEADVAETEDESLYCTIKDMVTNVPTTLGFGVIALLFAMIVILVVARR